MAHYKNKMFSQKSHLTAQFFPCCVFFPVVNNFSGRKLLISIWKCSKGGAQYLKAVNAKLTKNILKDAIHDLKMIWVGK